MAAVLEPALWDVTEADRKLLAELKGLHDAASDPRDRDFIDKIKRIPIRRLTKLCWMADPDFDAGWLTDICQDMSLREHWIEHGLKVLAVDPDGVYKVLPQMLIRPFDLARAVCYWLRVYEMKSKPDYRTAWKKLAQECLKRSSNLGCFNASYLLQLKVFDFVQKETAAVSLRPISLESFNFIEFFQGLKFEMERHGAIGEFFIALFYNAVGHMYGAKSDKALDGSLTKMVHAKGRDCCFRLALKHMYKARVLEPVSKVALGNAGFAVDRIFIDLGRDMYGAPERYMGGIESGVSEFETTCIFADRDLSAIKAEARVDVTEDLGRLELSLVDMTDKGLSF